MFFQKFLVIFTLTYVVAAPSVLNAQIANEWQTSPAFSDSYYLFPDFNAMSEEEREQYLKQADRVFSGATDSETDALIEWKNQPINPRFEKGENAHQLGCLVMGTFAPEVGACGHQEWNSDRYNEANQ